jgi:hypothetical protein
MHVDKRARNALGFYGRHVAGNALASGAAIFMVRVLCERGRARSGKVGNDGIGMGARIAHHICPRRLLPAGIDLRMALLASR